jgi:hypothetical protein
LSLSRKVSYAWKWGEIQGIRRLLKCEKNWDSRLLPTLPHT